MQFYFIFTASRIVLLKTQIPTSPSLSSSLFPLSSFGKGQKPNHGSSPHSCYDSPHRLCSSPGFQGSHQASSIRTTHHLGTCQMCGLLRVPPQTYRIGNTGWKPTICSLISSLGDSEARSSLQTSVVILHSWNSIACFLFLTPRVFTLLHTFPLD